MYVSAKLDPEYKQELIDLLKEFKDCFAWEYYEIPGLDQLIVGCQSNLNISHLNKLQWDLIQIFLMILSRLKDY